MTGTSLRSKVVGLSALTQRVEELRADGKSVAWTNGCFDILHAGHVLYLERAAREGDVLVVGMNDDASVKKVKGRDRPIVPEDERAIILCGLSSVDFVLPFSQSDTVSILEALRPEVYVKGGDYTLETINQDERRLVEGYGGRIALFPGVEGQSTTAIIERIAKLGRR